MSKKYSKPVTLLIGAVMSVVIFIVGVIGGVLVLINNDAYFEDQFVKNGVADNTGILMDDLMDVNNEVREFLLDQRDDLVVYADRNGESTLIFKDDEQSHMLDVKNLLADFLVVNYVCTVLLCAALFFTLAKPKEYVIKGLKYGSVGALIIPVIFVLFFDTMFVIFHEIFFPQGNWMFSLRTSLMVNMYTEPFFLNFCINLGVILLALCIVLFVISSGKLKKINEVK